jgi:hypothetical protein
VQEDGEGDEEEGLDQLRGHGRIQRLLVYSTCFSKQSFSMVLCLLWKTKTKQQLLLELYLMFDKILLDSFLLDLTMFLIRLVARHKPLWYVHDHYQCKDVIQEGVTWLFQVSLSLSLSLSHTHTHTHVYDAEEASHLNLTPNSMPHQYSAWLHSCWSFLIFLILKKWFETKMMVVDP